MRPKNEYVCQEREEEEGKDRNNPQKKSGKRGFLLSVPPRYCEISRNCKQAAGNFKVDSSVGIVDSWIR